MNGELYYGRCEVSIPKIHKIGKLETPSILRLEFCPNPKKHIILAKTHSLPENIFFELLRSSVAKSAAKDAFVFVHGYNVSFEDAARRTGQIAYDLDFVGAPISYSWPSNGNTADYLKDETNITWSTPHFERFLALLAQKSGAERIHIIAHSMGNRAVCDALKALSYDSTSQLKFNHLVLAAPDIDADTFKSLLPCSRGLQAGSLSMSPRKTKPYRHPRRSTEIHELANPYLWFGEWTRLTHLPSIPIFWATLTSATTGPSYPTFTRSCSGMSHRQEDLALWKWSTKMESTMRSGADLFAIPQTSPIP